jgi:hypothetical protein
MHQFKLQVALEVAVLVVTVSLKAHLHLKQHKTAVTEQQTLEVALEVHLWEIVLQVAQADQAL